MRVVDLQPNNVEARIDLGNILLAGGAATAPLSRPMPSLRSRAITQRLTPCSPALLKPKGTGP